MNPRATLPSALLLAGLLVGGPAGAFCLPSNDTASPCRFPAGDSWCAARDPVFRYAYRDDCGEEKNPSREPTPTLPPVRHPRAEPPPAAEAPEMPEPGSEGPAEGDPVPLTPEPGTGVPELPPPEVSNPYPAAPPPALPPVPQAPGGLLDWLLMAVWGGLAVALGWSAWRRRARLKALLQDALDRLVDWVERLRADRPDLRGDTGPLDLAHGTGAHPWETAPAWGRPDGGPGLAALPLPAETLDRLALQARPGEPLAAVVERALAALEAGPPGTPARPDPAAWRGEIVRWALGLFAAQALLIVALVKLL